MKIIIVLLSYFILLVLWAFILVIIVTKSTKEFADLNREFFNLKREILIIIEPVIEKVLKILK